MLSLTDGGGSVQAGRDFHLLGESSQPEIYAFRIGNPAHFSSSENLTVNRPTAAVLIYAHMVGLLIRHKTSSTSVIFVPQRENSRKLRMPFAYRRYV